MSVINDSSDRHHAPEGRRKGNIQLILIACLIAALCLIAYLLLFNQKPGDANASGRPEKKTASQLHTTSSAFEMPVFKAPELPKPEPLPEPEVIVAPEPVTEVIFEPLPKPEPLPVSEVIYTPEPLPKAATVNQKPPAKDRPVSDEERRLGSGIVGDKGIPTLSGKSGGVSTQRERVLDRPAGASKVVAEEPFFESEYEYQEGQKTEPKSAPNHELTANDIQRLDQLAALYGVSDSRTRSPTSSARSASVSRYESPSQQRSSQSSDNPRNVDSESGEQALTVRPINQASTHQSVGQGGSVDLSSTQAIGVQAQRIRLDYLLKRGTYIGCVLKTRIVSDQAGFISCGVTENIYSADGSNLLLPRGSEVLGEYKPKSLSNGKVRLQAVWDALTTPDGIRVNLGSPSIGRLGAAGIGGQINNHYGKRVGIPILLSLFRTAIDYRTRNYSGESGEYKQTGSDAADDVLSDQMQQYEEIRPTLTKQQGSTIGIMVARDVSFEKVLKGSR